MVRQGAPYNPQNETPHEVCGGLLYPRPPQGWSRIFGGWFTPHLLARAAREGAI